MFSLKCLTALFLIAINCLTC